MPRFPPSPGGAASWFPVISVAQPGGGGPKRESTPLVLNPLKGFNPEKTIKHLMVFWFNPEKTIKHLMVIFINPPGGPGG